MHIDIVRAALHRSPFQPFVLRLADGRSILVPHPDFVAVSPRQVFVVDHEDESVSWIEPLLIVSLDFAQPQTGTASGSEVEGNGNPPSA